MPVYDNDPKVNAQIAQALALAEAEAEAQQKATPAVGPDIMSNIGPALARGVTGVVDTAEGLTIPGMMRQASDFLRSPAGQPGGSVTQLATDAVPALGNEAQTPVGKGVSAVVEGLPYMALGGPEGLARNAISNVAGSVGGEVADQLAEGSGGYLEKFARLAGTLIGGGATAGRPGNLRSGVRGANQAGGFTGKRALSADELKTATDTMAGFLRDAGIHYDPNAFAMLGQQINARLNKLGSKRGVPGLDPMQNKAYQYADDLARRAGQVPDWSELERDASAVGEAARQAWSSGDTQLGKALDEVSDAIDEFTLNTPFASMSPQGPKTSGELRVAQSTYRDLALRNIKSRKLQEALTAAEVDPSGFVSGLNKQLRSIITRDGKKRLFNSAELKMISDVASARSPITALSKFGLDFGGPSAGLMAFKNASMMGGYGMAGAAANAIGGPIAAGALAVPIVGGTIAKAVEKTSKRKNFESVAATVRKGTGEAATALGNVEKQTNAARLRWLMLGAEGERPEDHRSAPRG